MSGTKASTFFWSDWRSDPNLRLCSYAARGLWMEMLAVMVEHEGYLRVADRNLEPAELAKMTGGDASEVAKLTTELERNGVFSRDRRRSIYCRRLVRGEKNRRNGRLGGEAKSRADQGNEVSPGQEALPLSPLPSSSTSDKSSSLNVVDDWPEDYFDRFWKLYPPGRKGERQNVMAKLARIRRDGKVTFAKLMAGLSRYAATNPDPQFTPAPMVWLNKGRWDVEIVAGGATNNGPTMLDIATGRRGGKP